MVKAADTAFLVRELRKRKDGTVLFICDSMTLPEVIRQLMQDVDAPRGIAELGYGEDDIPALVDGAMKQQRLLAVAPKEVEEDDLRHIITASMSNW